MAENGRYLPGDCCPSPGRAGPWAGFWEHPSGLLWPSVTPLGSSAQVAYPKVPQPEGGRIWNLKGVESVSLEQSSFMWWLSVLTAFLVAERWRCCCDPEAVLLVCNALRALGCVFRQGWGKHRHEAGRAFWYHCLWFVFSPSSAARNVSQPCWWQLHAP